MEDFGAETFKQAAAILSSTQEDCLKNIAVLKAERKAATQPKPPSSDSQGLLRLFRRKAEQKRPAESKLLPLDTQGLLSLLRREDEEGTIYCLLGEATETRQVRMSGEEQRYLLNTEIMFANVEARAAQDPAVSSHLGERYDLIALRCMALAEAFLHLSKVAASPDLGMLILNFVGLARTNDSMDKERATRADKRLGFLIEDYMKRLEWGTLDLINRGMDSVRILTLGKTVYRNTMPLWHTERDAPGSRFINDVWMPERYATPLMMDLAKQQAASMTRS